MTDALHPGDRLHDAYTIERLLGRGGQGSTWLATTDDGKRVAVKHLDLKHAEGWKAIELFEREGRVLAQLDHPGIPRYIDALREESPALRLCLVQEFVEGDTVAARIARGQRWDEEALRAFLLEALDLLGYLGKRHPPVIHRDIKPNNLILRPDGRLALIDFGGVLADLSPDTGGSTVVGTTGYMPPEQLMGRATPASDLYALGATAIHMHTGRSPADLPVQRMRLVYHDRARLSAPMLAFLDRLTDPTPEDRFQSAQEARDALLAPVKAAAPSAPNAPAAKAPSGQGSVLGAVAPLIIFIVVCVGLLYVLRPSGPARNPVPADRPLTLGALPLTVEAGQAAVSCAATGGSGGATRKPDGSHQGWYNPSCTLLNTSPDHDLMQLSGQLQLFDADGKLIAGQPWTLWSKDEGPLRPGERHTSSVQVYEALGVPARATLRITDHVALPTAPPEATIPVEITYEAPEPPGVALSFTEFELVPPDRPAMRYTTRLRFKLAQTGAAAVRTISLRVEARDAKGQPLPPMESALQHTNPLMPGPAEVRTVLLPNGAAAARLVVTKLHAAR